MQYIVSVSVAMLLLLVILTIITRRKWAGFAGTVAVFGALAALAPGTPLERLIAVVIQATVIGLVARVGILASVVAGTMAQILSWLPLTFDPSVWYAPYGWTVLAGFAVLAAYAFHFSRGRQPLLARSLLAE